MDTQKPNKKLRKAIISRNNKRIITIDKLILSLETERAILVLDNEDLQKDITCL